MNGYRNAVTSACQDFIDRVIDNFINQVMQRFLIRSAHIHAGAAPDGLQPFQNLDIFCSV